MADDEQYIIEYMSTYACENEDNILSVISEIFAHEYNVPIRALKVLARTCKHLRAVVTSRLKSCYELRARWILPFALAYMRRHVTRKWAVPYDDCEQIIVPLDMNMYASNDGILPCVGILNDAHQRTRRYALVDISLRAINPIPFSIAVFVKHYGALYPVTYDEVGPELYFDTEVPAARYYTDVNLATRMNPILIGEGGVNAQDIQIMICQRPHSDAESVGMIMDFDFLAEHFTAMTLKFRTADASVCDQDLRFVPPSMYLDKFRMPVRMLIQKKLKIDAEYLLQ